MVVVRGDHRVNEIKLANALGADVPARARGGVRRADRAGGLHRTGRHRRADPARRRGRARRLHHRRQPRERAPARRRARPRLPVQARRRPPRRAGRHGRRPPDPDRARDRGRQHLQARHPLLRAARRDLPRRVGQGRSRSGWARTASARRASPRRPIEQFADEQGISWPRSIAPFDLHLVGLGKEGSEERALGRARCTRSSQGTGLRVLYDDRDAGPGEKFADAELLGVPAAR